MTDTQLLEWLDKHPQCEISHAGEEWTESWKVHEVTGGRNDREWRLVGEGETVRIALFMAQEEMKRRGK